MTLASAKANPETMNPITSMLGPEGTAANQRAAPLATAKFGIIAADEEASAIRAHLPSDSVTVFGVDELLARCTVQWHPSGSSLSIEKPAIMLGSVAISAAADQRLNAFDGSLALFFKPQGRSHLTLDKPDQSALLTWTVQQLLAAATETLEDMLQLRRSLSVLRREHEETLTRFGTLERQASYYGAPAKVFKVGYPPAGSVFSLDSDPDSVGSAAVIRQRLSTTASGLASIELHLARAPRGQGLVEVRLLTGGGGSPVQTWREPVSEMKPGWNGYHLDRALESSAFGPEIEIRYIGDFGGKVDLTLSTALPLEEFSAQYGGRSLGAPLALRAWGAAPGTLVTEALTTSTSRDVGALRSQAGLQRRIPLSIADLQRAELLAPHDPDITFNLVEFRSQSEDLLVHPVNNTTVIGVIRKVHAKNIKRLSALVLVDNRGALPVEFSLTATAAGSAHIQAVDLLKAWTRVEPDMFAEVEGTVQVPSSGAVDIIVGTRMADGADAHLAWACFKRIDLFI